VTREEKSWILQDFGNSAYSITIAELYEVLNNPVERQEVAPPGYF